MKNLHCVIVCLFLLCSCSKKGNNGPASTVTIDGRAYKIVKIGTRAWTSENFDGSGGIAVHGVDESVYGKLYSWTEAQAVTLPAGWRIPTKADFKDLLLSQGSSLDSNNFGIMALTDTTIAKRFKSTTNWTISGNNATGFNAQPAGYYNNNFGNFTNTYAYAYFWGSTFTDHGANPATQSTLKLVGFFESAGIGHGVNVGAVIDAFEAGGKISYSLRFVKDM